MSLVSQHPDSHSSLTRGNALEQDGSPGSSWADHYLLEQDSKEGSKADMYLTMQAKPSRAPRVKPMTLMDGDNLVEIRRATRDTRAEFTKNIKSYRLATQNQMNKELAIQYKDEILRIKNITQEQNKVYRMMCQTYARKKQIALSGTTYGDKPWQDQNVVIPKHWPGTNSVLRRRMSKMQDASLKYQVLQEGQGVLPGRISRKPVSDKPQEPSDKYSLPELGKQQDAPQIEPLRQQPTKVGLPASPQRGQHLQLPGIVGSNTGTSFVSFLPSINENSPKLEHTSPPSCSRGKPKPTCLVLDVNIPTGNEGAATFISTGGEKEDETSDSNEETEGDTEQPSKPGSEPRPPKKKLPLSLRRKRQKLLREKKRKEILDAEEVPVYTRLNGKFESDGNHYLRKSFYPPSSASKKRRLKLAETIQKQMVEHNKKIESFFEVVQFALHQDQESAAPEKVQGNPTSDQKSDSELPAINTKTSIAPASPTKTAMLLLLDEPKETHTPESPNKKTSTSKFYGKASSTPSTPRNLPATPVLSKNTPTPGDIEFDLEEQDVSKCMYVRHYVRPEERQSYTSKHTSWNQKY